jgi:hypothetical protein
MNRLRARLTRAGVEDRGRKRRVGSRPWESRIVIPPAPARRRRLYREEWEAVPDDLEAAGFDAVIEPPVERRDAGSVILETAITVAATKSLDVLVETVRKHLDRRDRNRPPVIVYGPDGEVLAPVELLKADSCPARARTSCSTGLPREAANRCNRVQRKALLIKLFCSCAGGSSLGRGMARLPP